MSTKWLCIVFVGCLYFQKNGKQALDFILNLFFHYTADKILTCMLPLLNNCLMLVIDATEFLTF